MTTETGKLPAKIQSFIIDLRAAASIGRPITLAEVNELEQALARDRAAQGERWYLGALPWHERCVGVCRQAGPAFHQHAVGTPLRPQPGRRS